MKLGKRMFALFLTVVLFAACINALDYTAFKGKTMGILPGTVCDDISKNVLGATSVYYSDTSAAVEDIRKGRIDGFMIDLSVVKLVANYPGNENLACIEIPAEIFFAPMGAISANQNIIENFNIFLAKAKADGTLADMQDRWINKITDLSIPMPDIPLTGKNGTLKIATDDAALPFCYLDATGGELKGYSIELALRFAQHEEMDIEFIPMDFTALIPYVVSGKADLGIEAISITEERKEIVLFTDSIYDDQFGILTLKTTANNSSPTLVYTDFADKKMGVATGSVCDQVTTDNIGGIPVYYSEDSAGLEDMRNGRIDGYMTDLSAAHVIASLPGNELFQVVEIPAAVFFAPLGAISSDEKIIERFNILIAKLKADGTLNLMHERWLENIPDLNTSMPEIPLTGENGALKVATGGTALPFSYVGANNEMKGFSIELVRRFAQQEGKTLDFVTMAFSGLIPYVASGRADLGIEAISITEERRQSVLFSDSYYDDQLGILTLKPGNDPSIARVSGGFAAWLKTSIERNLITDTRWKLIVDGLGVTLFISFAAQILGTAWACFICFLLTRKNQWLRRIGNLYCGLIYGLPMLVLLMITYYIIFGSTSISNVFIAIAAFTLVEGAGIAQNLKDAIDTVDPVEIEAALSLGFPSFRAFTAITLPQALRRALPGYTRGFIELVKATAIVGFIAIQDLTRAGDIIRSRTFDAYFPILFVALIYLVVTTLCVQLLKLAVNRVNKGAAA